MTCAVSWSLTRLLDLLRRRESNRDSELLTDLSGYRRTLQTLLRMRSGFFRETLNLLTNQRGFFAAFLYNACRETQVETDHETDSFGKIPDSHVCKTTHPKGSKKLVKKPLIAAMGLATFALGIGISVPALAAENEPSTSLVINYVNVQKTPSGVQWTVKVSNLLSNGNVRFRMLSSSQQSQFQGDHGNTDDVGSTLASLPVPGGSPSSKIFTFTTSSNAYASHSYLYAGEYNAPKEGSLSEPSRNSDSAKEIRQESPAVSLTSVPYGQLPEVPFAAGLPLIGLGLSAAWWIRSRRPRSQF